MGVATETAMYAVIFAVLGSILNRLNHLDEKESDYDAFMRVFCIIMGIILVIYSIFLNFKQ
ncbi:MAG: hypothetical protein LBL79_07375 [Prevotella sp.]|jgi:hypothetical protein|nr:hypothetical protein [Prevotella sp.]